MNTTLREDLELLLADLIEREVILRGRIEHYKSLGEWSEGMKSDISLMNILVFRQRIEDILK